jgi:acylpyruvate hydrolase
LPLQKNNNSEHITELNNTRPKQPFFFLKPPSSILLPGQGPVLRPKGVSLHYEVELALVMGRTIRDFDPNNQKGAIDAIDSMLCQPSSSVPPSVLLG